MKLNEKALEAAWSAYEYSTGDHKGAMTEAIRAYLSASLPADAAELVERLESHMGKQDVSVLLADCRLTAALIQSQAAGWAADKARISERDELLAKFMDFADSDYVPNALFERARALLNRRAEG